MTRTSKRRHLTRSIHSNHSQGCLEGYRQQFEQNRYKGEPFMKNEPVSSYDRELYAIAKIKNRHNREKMLIHLNTGINKEHFEHPELTIEDAQNIAADHIRKNPNYYNPGK